MCKDDLCVFLSFSVFCFLFASKVACSRDFRAQIRLVCSSDLALPAATRRGRVELMPSMASRYSQRPSGPDDDKRRSFKDGWGQAPGGGGASSSAPPISEKRKREQPEDDSASKKLAPIFPPYLVFYYFIFPHCSLFLLGSLLTAMWNPFRFFCFFVCLFVFWWGQFWSPDLCTLFTMCHKNLAEGEHFWSRDAAFQLLQVLKSYFLCLMLY